MSAFQTDFCNFAGYFLVSGCFLALGTGASTPLTPGYRGYAHVPVVWGNPPADGGDEGTAYLTAAGGVLTNAQAFKWPEADDETGVSSDGWVGISHFLVLDSSGNVRYSAAFPQSFSVPQDWRPKFEAGQLRITFDIQEVSP